MTTRSLCSLLLVAAATSTTALPAQCANAWQSTGVVPGVDGSVNAMTAWDPDGPGPATERIAIGGFFRAGGAAASNVAAWDPATGTWSSLGAGIGGASVAALLAMPNGDLIAGGAFTTAQGAVGDHLARWNGSAWVPFGGLTPFENGVRALARMPNGDIAVGGSFVAAGPTTLNFVAIWNGTSWSTLGGGVNGWVNALTVLPNGDLVAAGYFDSAGGVPVDGIARWNGTTWSSLGSVPAVYGLAAQPNGDVIAVGSFTQAGGVPANGVARWNGTSWSALGSGLAGTGAEVVVTQNGDLLVGGAFAQAGGVAASCIARWNGSVWSPLGSGLAGTTSALATLTSGDVIAGGAFGVAGGVPANRVARWNGTAWSALTAGTAPSNPVEALLAMPDGSIVAGGRFQAVGGIVANGVARFDGVSWSTLGSGPSSTAIYAMTLAANGDLVAAGAGSASRWNGATWSTLGNAQFSPAHAVATLPNGDIVVGCAYASMPGGWLVYGAARWDGTSWSELGSGVFGEVIALAVLDNGDLIAGGDLITAGNTTVHGIARWNGTTWSSLGSGLQSPGLGGAFAILPLANGALIAGGVFTTAGGVAANNIATWNGTSWSPLGSGINGPVLELERLPNGDVLASGAFTQAGGVAVNNVARWNGTAWSAVGSGVTLSLSSSYWLGGARTIAAAPNGDLFFGGSIVTAGGQPSSNLARLTTTCPAAAQTQGAGCAGNVVTASLPWTGATWRADASGLPSSALVAVVNGFAPVSLPLATIFATAIPGCTLHVQPDFVDLVLAVNGTASFQFALPNTPVLAGVTFHHQMVPLALGGALAVTATNSLQLTVGSF